MLAPLKTPVRSEFVEINDVKIEVERRGKGAPLLLLPGEEALEVEMMLLVGTDVLDHHPPGLLGVPDLSDRRKLQ